ncbi:MAG: hypothetical protein ACI8S7_002201, partial [Candidatus Krumholzibacteriia bacterium]
GDRPVPNGLFGTAATTRAVMLLQASTSRWPSGQLIVRSDESFWFGKATELSFASLQSTSNFSNLLPVIPYPINSIQSEPRSKTA